MDADWPRRIAAVSDERCDLNLLLRDERRCRAIVRDEPHGPRADRSQGFRLAGEDYRAMRGLLRDHGSVGVSGIAALVLQQVLAAYGHGDITVIAFGEGARMLPVIADHREQAEMSRLDAAAGLERELRDAGGYLPWAAVAQRGLLDVALVLAAPEPADAELPPVPLVTVVRDTPADNCLYWTQWYPQELFEDAVIAGLLDVAREALRQVVHRPDAPVRDIELVSPESATMPDRVDAGEAPKTKRLNELFEEAAHRTPDFEAVVCGPDRLTYRELNDRANRLAHYLTGPAVAVGAKERIAMLLDKSELGVIVVLGLWKASCVYVPIDPDYPPERIRFTLGDTQARLVITTRKYASRLSGLAGYIIEIDTFFGEGGEAWSQRECNPAGAVGEFAYVTYTSGTTGVPKGVPKAHASAVNSITDLSQRYGMLEPGTERVALYASYAFEPHLRQTLIALINSQTLVVVPDEIRLDPDLLPKFLAEQRVTYLNATGSVLQQFDLHRCSDLKRILLVGEELTAAGLRGLREQFAGWIINEYAFTEAAFVTSIKEFEPGVSERADRSIGRSLRNVTWYVLGQNLKRLPVGAVGELYIGGAGVASGYLNRDDLTAERFIANPFQTEQDRRQEYNSRLYRTGDIARLLPNGEVEYLGRSDFQLKINGVRIEPGEIEARAREFPGVHDCVVVAQEATGDSQARRLVGYFVADSAVEIAETDLLAFLEQLLIRVMVPSRMIRLPRLPVTVNGKVDRRALPDPFAVASMRDEPHADDELFEALREIWGAVLGMDASTIHSEDDFFRLGGQSISCILLIARARQRLHLHLTVEDVFGLRTLSALVEHLRPRWASTGRRRRVFRSETPQPTADQAPIEAGFALPANGLQQGLIYHWLKYGGDDAYVMQSVYRYRCAIDSNLMRVAWAHAYRKYPGLRVTFTWRDEPLQIIGGTDAPLDWRVTDISDLDLNGQNSRIDDLQEDDRARRYELDRGPLLRIHLIKQAEDLYALLFSCHHIVMDGWSLPLLHDEVHLAYLRLLGGQTLDSSTDTVYIAAQRHWQAHRDDHVGYWTREISRIGERGDLTGLVDPRCRYKVQLRDYDNVREHRTRMLRLDTELTAALREACTTHQVTLHSAVQFAWHRVLYAIGGGRTTVVGTVVSGRSIPVAGIESSVGLYINTLPLVVDHDEQSGARVALALAAIQSAVNAMNSRSTVDLGRLQSDAMKRQLFDTLLVLEDHPRLLQPHEKEQLRLHLPFEMVYDTDKVDYPLAVIAREDRGELTISIWYSAELFPDSAIDTLLDTAYTVLAQIPAGMDRTVRDLELVSSATLAQFEAWNDTAADFPADKTLNEVFESAAARWPEQTAVVYKNVSLTYRELNERANRLAHHLRAATPLRPNDLVSLVLDKSETLIVSIIAVWKTGAAFVPMDPGDPDERLSFMLDDTGVRLVLCDSTQPERLRGLCAVPVLDVDSLDPGTVPAHNLTSDVTSTDLAYAIYTSGTTGMPKAVLVEHRGVVNLHASLSRMFSLAREDSDEAFLSFSNPVFDHFIEQMTDALLNGQKLVVLDDALRTDGARLCRYLNDNDVTYLSGTPSVLSLYDFSSATTLTRIDAIGEDLTEPVFEHIRRGFSGCIINGYGPTEVSITSHKRLYGADQPRLDKSIGLPVSNTACYVLDSALKRVPVGGIGELYIGGIGLARGYLNRPELTGERFMDNPFRSERDRAAGTNSRLYRTGDLVRWLPNGELECLGRTDLQVKIRGQRVELSEIEGVLTSHPEVSRCVVIAREHPAPASSAAQKHLVAFYLSTHELPEQELRRWLRRSLPEAIIPAWIVRLDSIPLTVSGKLDTRRLPETDFATRGGTVYQAPRGDVELKLCGIWSRVLAVRAELIGTQDDFFSLGGDSLRAMSLVQAITEAFGHGFGIDAVLAHTTLAAQADNIIAATSADRPRAGSAAGLAATRAGDPPVSPAQQRLLFIDGFEAGTSAYNIPLRFEVDAAAEEVTEALRTLVRRHPSLRTLIRRDGEGAHRQHVLAEPEALARWQIPTSADPGHVFRLDEELPIRVQISGRPGATQVDVVVHHTCFDGWSLKIFRRELDTLLRGGTLPNPPAATYVDFVLWQEADLSGERLVALSRYWAQQLSGFEPVRLPLDHPRPQHFDYRGREIFFDLARDTTDRLRELAQSARVSLYSVLLGAWCLMLNAYCGQDDLVVGTPIANRGRPEFADVVGLFANLLVLRVRVPSAATLGDYLREVAATVVAAQVHGELPFERLVMDLGVDKDPSRHPIVQINFTLQNAAVHPGLRDHHPQAGGYTSAKFDLSATVSETPQGLRGNLTYAASLFDENSAAGMVATFRHLLGEFARLTTIGQPVALVDISVVPHEDQQALLAGGRSAPVHRPAGHTVAHSHGLFEKTAKLRPQDIAVVCGPRRLSYRSLDEDANRLAHHLCSVAAPRPSELIAVVMDKSDAMITALLAVWKAGAAYVPINPGTPDDRVAFILSDTGARLVLTDPAHRQRLQESTTRPVLAFDPGAFATMPSTPPDRGVTGDDLAYAIYTSGTTGKPKAVLVRHRNLLSLHRDLSRRYFPDPAVRQTVLLLANYVFDFSVEQLVLSILSGNKLIVPAPEMTLPDEEFYELADRERLSYLSGTPTQITRFDLTRLEWLRFVLVAGESFQRHHFDKIRREFTGPLYNAYGTTETTVYNTVHCFAPGDGFVNTLGSPLANTRTYVLGVGFKLLPVGAIGELYLSGECVAAGYLNRLELTEQRFLENPFAGDADAVIYRTGDLVRLRPSGAMEYVGRNDTQVKVRGLRIELGEIEAALAACPGVGQCVVLARDDQHSSGGKRLVGYYYPNGDPEAVEERVLEALRGRLMASMVPALVRLGHPLPTTVNGKLDPDALPRLDLSAGPVTYAAPRNRIDALLCRLWAEHLAGVSVGIDGDFFRCGGDSIGAMHLASRIEREIPCKISIKQLFDFPTVRRFADNVLTATPSAVNDGEQGRLSGDVPLLPIQKWFFGKPLRHRGHWNQTFGIRTPCLDVGVLRQALDRLVDHHDAFRLRYRGRKQFYAEDAAPPHLHSLDVRQVPDDDLPRRFDLWQQGFDLEHGPLACAAYLHGFPDGSARVWLAMHHLISDVVSWQILTRDLEILYHGGELGPKMASYRQWALAMRSYRPAPAERELWEGIARDLKRTAPRQIPDDVPELTAEARSERFELTEEQTRALLTDCHRAYDTDINDLLLTAVAMALRSVTGRADNYVTVEGHGREHLDGAPAVRDTVGWFTTMYPLKLRSGGDPGESILLTRATRRRIPHNGLGYGVLRGAYGAEDGPLASVSVNYLGRLGSGGQSVEHPRWRLDAWLCGVSKAGGHTGDGGTDITMSCIGDRLVTTVDSRLGGELVRQLTHELKQRLQELIAHTRNASAARGCLREPFEPYLVVGEDAEHILFVLPPGEGGAESYLNNLAGRLHGHRLVLFNNLHLHSPHDSFESLGEHYLRHILQLQSSGPYHLMGWSFGGVLALEIARQLACAGEPIGNLILIDPYFDTRGAAASVGLPGADVLDPINHFYSPQPADLRRLHELTNTVLLYKADRPNDVVTSEDQRRLFGYYHLSRYNNLDLLIPADHIRVETLAGETHHSWVHNRTLVDAMGAHITSLMATSARAQTETAHRPRPRTQR